MTQCWLYFKFSSTICSNGPTQTWLFPKIKKEKRSCEGEKKKGILLFRTGRYAVGVTCLQHNNDEQRRGWWILPTLHESINSRPALKCVICIKLMLPLSARGKPQVNVSSGVTSRKKQGSVGWCRADWQKTQKQQVDVVQWRQPGFMNVLNVQVG